MTIAPRLGVVLLLLASSPAFGQSQSWLYVTSQAPASALAPGGPVVFREITLPPGGPASVTRELRMPGTLGSAPVVTFDGRWVAWIVTPEGSVMPALALFDRSTGVSTVLPGLGGQTVIADPSALRLFVLRATAGDFVDTIVILEPGLVRQVTIPPIRMAGPLSADGRDLYVSRQIVDPSGTSFSYHIAIVDPLTGAERRRLPSFEPFNAPTGVAVSRDGTRVFVTMEGTRNLRVLDGMTGAELASVTIPSPFPGLERIGGVTFDEQHQRLFVRRIRFYSFFVGTTTALILDSDTLTRVSETQTGTHVVDGVQRIVVGITSHIQFSGCGEVLVETWAGQATPISSFDVPLDGGCPRLGVATAPEAPTTLTSTVAGRQVTLDWTAVGGGVDYQIEVGSAPGHANLGVIRTGGSRPFVVEGVPPGTYYVSVRAINYVGYSAPSNERIIVVP